MDLNGGAYRTLVDGSLGAAYKPAWSTVGDNIAYVQRTDTSNDIWIVPAHDGGPYQLTHLGTCASPTWSPDSRYLAFFREEDGNFAAWYVEVSAGADGHLSAGDPKKLFSADNIDAQSGMSWSAT
jgi:Tol biopolymer transport system component